MVTLSFRGARLEVEILDDGGSAAAPTAADDGGHGIVGMRERVALLGGELEGRRLPGRGSTPARR